MKIAHIKMQITMENGETVECLLTYDGITRYGASREAIAETVDCTERLLYGIPEDNGWA